MSSAKRVLVTGGAGYIGVATVEELLDSNYEVVVLDNFLWGRHFLDHVADRITIIEGDMRNSRDLVHALKDIHTVVHLGGIVGDPACKVNLLAHHTCNVECVSTLVNCMTDPNLHHVPELIFSSSCSVYGNVKGMYDEVTEDTPTNPLSYYADAKLRAEEIINKKAAEVPSFHPTILRLTTLFGWAPRPRIDLVTNMFVYKAIRDGGFSVFGGGHQYRSLVHVRDVARAIVHTMNTPRFIRDRKIFHVGDEGNNMPIKDIAKLIKKQIPDAKIDFPDAGEADRRDYSISCAKIRSVLGFEIKYTVDDGIAHMIKNINKHNFTYDPLIHGNAKYPYT